ncbi:hypothetical protein [Luteolibacter luteus]|uniref:Cytochrome c domain-containing protein n=1 Tax=Luteolibacter luteus TaxID=2728835 RepID=A0A858RCL3_9BACT|nr:hypothetical protein [Luteolibacter luteus]QJE94344.1 hypothetical protein HHL09_00600 [Luteolibacter luteus]
MFLRPVPWLACLFLAPVWVGDAVALDYGALPLRGDQSPLPYYATSGGRDGKRFTDAAVNRYRIYDFYARQADYYLANPSDRPELLPPFPELDGGRRGHWGGTNDRESGAYDRPKGPDFTTVTSRAGKGIFHVLAGPAQDPGVIVFNGTAGCFEGFYPSARMSAPRHTFSFEVDRFGFSIDVAGKATLAGAGDDWRCEGRKTGRFTGYYVHGSSAVFRSEVEGAGLLERPSIIVSKDGSQRFLSRDFEFVSGLEKPVSFQLPQIAGLQDGAVVKWSAREIPGSGGWLVRGEAGDLVCLHRVKAAGSVKLKPQGGGAVLEVTAASAGGRWRVLSWGGSGSLEDGIRAELLAVAAQDPAPSSLLDGGPSRFGETIEVAGVLDVDPACRGGAYVIDDIPVPIETNPYRTPMTLSGIDFAADGSAYVTTLVGDVWKVTGLEGDLGKVVWKRYAAGLDLPMGVEVVNGAPHVNARRFIFRLVDLNGDGEADYYERFSREDIPQADDAGRDLHRDAAGNFYFNARSGIFRIAADGSGLTKVGEGSRNPFGLSVRKDGLVFSDSSEGESNNGTCTIYESAHPENVASTAKQRRILYLPRGVDNSPGSRLFLDEPRFGPLGQSLLGISYGTGGWYYMVRDSAEGTPQAAVVPMPGSFASGACRVAVQPRDGQVFVAGLDGWGDYAVAEGCLHRVRWTGRESAVMTGWKACKNGLLLTFKDPLGPQVPAPEKWFVQQWNYVDSTKTYGSPEYSARFPGRIGHDRLEVRSVQRTDEGGLFLEIPGLLPSMCLQVHARMGQGDEEPWLLDAYFTLNHLMADSPLAAASGEDKPVVLRVPEEDANGDTYENVVSFFDQLYGRTTAGRAESAAIAYRREELSYAWLRKNLIDAQCMPCHGAGTQHDFTTYEGLMKKVDPANPGKSPILGMLQTKSMPPYPLPSVPAATCEAVLEWIKQGAKE